MSYYINPNISFEGMPDGTVSMKIRDIGGGEVKEVCDIVLTPDVYTDVLRQFNSMALHAIEDALREMAYGPCETCKNYRLVDVEKRGRMEKVRCPDCEARMNQKAVNRAIVASVPRMYSTPAYGVDDA